MSRVALNKSSLAREIGHLAEYRRFLPSLELKRLQIVSERARAKTEAARLDEEVKTLVAKTGAALPMLANEDVPLDGLVTLEHVEVSARNLSGTLLPVLGDVSITVRDYPRLGRPHWVDAVVTALRELIRLQLERDIAHARLETLIEAERVISRRVNLFEKVLIPRAEGNIRRIRMALADADREAVIRAKLAKRKTAARAAGARMAEL
ncbi:V-type ATP synthase subunit D [Stappia indica]|uniref:V-type ATP synthase subunit D n=1 Tax=Stappia indica TaxID=538381 RepID=UPI001CD1F015|nr:V-type ATP synthase subunit D [Stappia indica]MCA1297362.1 V-type ATP synthase subunit D [Stappia indica]